MAPDTKPLGGMPLRAVLVASLLSVAVLPTAAPIAVGFRERPAPAQLQASRYAVPRTPWGDPDLQGVWTTDDALNIPLERPARFGNRLHLTDEEFATRVKADNLNRRFLSTSDVGSRTFRQTSLVSDPPDGQLPALTAEAAQRRASSDRGSSGPGPFNWVTDFTLLDRCITRGVLGSVLPAINSNGLRIVQAPGVVAISHEVIHETRIIHTDGRPHAAASIRGYMGDSRGRWDHETLVIETTNLTNRTSVGTNGTGARHSVDMRLTERLTRTAADLIAYEVRVEDPQTYVRPFTITLPITGASEASILPYECHEGNYTLANMLRGARVDDNALSDAGANGLTSELASAQALPLTITISSAGGEASEFTGTWHASIASAITVALSVNGTVVTGAVRVVTAAQTISLETFDGRVDGRRIVFKINSPDGDRSITFTGTVDGDEMTFTRDVEVRPGGSPGGRQIFGAQGPRAFTATRMK